MCESRRLRSQFSVSGRKPEPGGEVSVSGLGARNRLRQSLRVRLLYRTFADPDPPTVIVQAYRGDTDTSEVTIVQATPCTNLRFAADGRESTFAQRTRKMGHPRVGVCPRNQKQDQTKTKTKIRATAADRSVRSTGRTRPAPLRCLALHWSPFAAGGRESYLCQRTRKMGHPGAGVRLKKIKTKIKSKTKPRSKATAGTECPLYTGESADALIEDSVAGFDPSVVPGKMSSDCIVFAGPVHNSRNRF